MNKIASFLAGFILSVSAISFAAWDGSGTFSRVMDWTDDRDAAIPITASRMDAEDDNFAAGINAALTKNNESKPTANFEPNADDTYDLGSSSKEWQDLYVDGTAYIDEFSGGDFNGTEVILDADGDTSLTADTDDRLDIKIGGSDSVVIGAGTGNTTSFFLIDPGAITATANTNFARVRIRNNNAVTVPTGTTAVVSSLAVTEPNITATGTVTAASTVYIANAPTEGGSNYALWVDSGDVQFDGNLTVNGSITETGTGWATPSFDAGNFTASGSMTWTVASGDVTTYAYKQIGKTMFIMFDIVTTTVGGTPDLGLRIAIPNSKVVTKAVNTLGYASDNGGAVELMIISAGASGTYLTLNLFDGSNWAASTNQTRVTGQIFLEVN